MSEDPSDTQLQRASSGGPRSRKRSASNLTTTDTETPAKRQKKANSAKPAKNQLDTSFRVATTAPPDLPLVVTEFGKQRLVGAHVSIQGGFPNALKRTEAMSGNVFQIFTKSNKTWNVNPIEEAAAADFKSAHAKCSFARPSQANSMVHATYLINLGSSDEGTREKSVTLLTHEAARCDQLGIPFLVLHPGSHTGDGLEKSVSNIAKGLDRVYSNLMARLKTDAKVMILLETAAGQGSAVGVTFAELNSIRDQTQHKLQIGICLDTCHIYSAGYDISTKKGFDATLDEFDRVFGGFQLLKAIHVNNSKTGLGAKVDRHAHLRSGTLPMDTFRWLMNDPRLAHVPMVLETPEDDGDDYAFEIELLRSFVQAPVPPEVL